MVVVEDIYRVNHHHRHHLLLLLLQDWDRLSIKKTQNKEVGEEVILPFVLT
jgi:hypothetical protein